MRSITAAPGSHPFPFVPDRYDGAFPCLVVVSSTSDKTKHPVAQYFNPVKLVDMTTLKKVIPSKFLRSTCCWR